MGKFDLRRQHRNGRSSPGLTIGNRTGEDREVMKSEGSQLPRHGPKP
jgi:hypothetical protein